MNAESNKKISIYFLLLLALIVGGLHIVGTYLYIYWRVPNFDRVVHSASGFFVAMATVAAFKAYRPFAGKIRSTALAFSAVLAVGVLWEMFELYSGATALADAHFWGAAFSDITFDALGGLVAGAYFIKSSSYS